LIPIFQEALVSLIKHAQGNLICIKIQTKSHIS
jgi:nitrate/nitrite-specific signal transduction histidine kinase